MDEVVAAPDRHALQGADRKRLLQVLDDLRSEVCAETDVRKSDGEGLVQGQQLGALSEEDEQLVASLREGLESLAGGRQEQPARVALAVEGALDGAEFVVRGDILMGQLGRLPQLLPSFVFLVRLPLSGKPEALRISRRAARLLSDGVPMS